MRAGRARTKKLIVAFHFQFSNPAAWKCAECRKNGLEDTRRCGRAARTEVEGRAVWARGRISTTVCPKSYITAESAAWLEAFYLYKRLGWPDPRTLGAREAHAMAVLEEELSREMNRGHE